MDVWGKSRVEKEEEVCGKRPGRGDEAILPRPKELRVNRDVLSHYNA